MAHKVCFLVLLLVAGCGASSSNGMEMVELDAGPLEQWMGKSEADVLMIWGEPKKTEVRGDTKTHSYVMMRPAALKVSFDKPADTWESGPKTQGFDNDMLGAIKNMMLHSCFVGMTLGKDLLVTSVKLTKFRAAHDCDDLMVSKLPLTESND